MNILKMFRGDILSSTFLKVSVAAVIAAAGLAIGVAALGVILSAAGADTRWLTWPLVSTCLLTGLAFLVFGIAIVRDSL